MDLETRLAVEEWFRNAQGEILATLRAGSTDVEELCDQNGRGDCATTLLGSLIEAVEQDVDQKGPLHSQ